MEIMSDRDFEMDALGLIGVRTRCRIWTKYGIALSLHLWIGSDYEKGVTHPTVSPQVGTVSPSHMKLPTKAQIAEINNVAGINTEVAIITGRTNTRSRKMCA